MSEERQQALSTTQVFTPSQTQDHRNDSLSSIKKRKGVFATSPTTGRFRAQV